MILTLHRQRQKDQRFQASLGYNATPSQTTAVREPSKARVRQTSEWVFAISLPCNALPGPAASPELPHPEEHSWGAHSWGRRARLPIYRGGWPLTVRVHSLGERKGQTGSRVSPTVYALMINSITSLVPPSLGRLSEVSGSPLFSHVATETFLWEEGGKMFLDLSPVWDPALGTCPYLGTSPCNCWEPLNSRMTGHLEVSHRGSSPCHSEACVCLPTCYCPGPALCALLQPG